MSEQNQFVFLPLGGVGEIGMNLGMYGFGPVDKKSWIVVDFGLGFARETQPGVDLIFPDIRFLESEKNNVLGIILTHAHEDHYGGLVDLWERVGAPVYATPFTAAMLEAKLDGAPWAGKIPINTISQTERWNLGPFDLEMVPVSHSIPEPNALAIRTPLGLALHTGDWKIDPTPVVGEAMDVDRLKEIGEEGVLALICDSTNAVRDGISPSEADIAAGLYDFIKDAPNRVAVTSFASNVARMRTVAEVAEKAGRDVILVGRAMQRVSIIARELGFFDGIKPFLSEDDFGYLPRNKVLVMCTGSQGEDRAALARIANGSHRNIKLVSGDRVIFSSRTIPGNEVPVNTVINSLCDQGMEVITDRDGLVHVSGHPRRGELVQMYDWMKPEIAVPVHGEPLHLSAHAKLASEQGVKNVVQIRNGALVKLAPGKPGIIDNMQAGRLHKDGKLITEPETGGVGERRKLSFAGVVSVSLVMSRQGEILDEPAADLYGLPDFDSKGADFEDIILDAIDGVLDSMPAKRRKNSGQLEESVRRAIRGEVQHVWGKKPVCQVRVHIV
ncbi:ribonuclease J [Pararhizobium sp. IMCC21322]|uniref:ribonuclease J n=1 Tax=Pararhizobium sp. IMCC21322 TaxID=3067903 RepID=UPI002740E009|nr:ribonuclease J [Pararhizobium sp. IMCC21322]